MSSNDDSPPEKAKPSRRRQQPEQVRARILKAALNQFAMYGFEGSSARTIATDAHVSISLLLYHFKSKEVLWHETIRHVFSVALPGAAQDPEPVEGQSAADRLAHIIERSVRMFSAFPALHRLMTLEGHQPTDRLMWMCDTFIRDNFKEVCSVIADAQREGAVVEGDPAQIRMAITAMAAVPFSVSAEYQYLTRHNPFAKTEVDATISLIKRLIFKPR